MNGTQPNPTDYASILAAPSSDKKQKRPIVVLYGTGGIGKTTFACGAPNPAVLAFEDGAHALGVRTFPNDGVIQEWSEGLHYAKALAYGQHDYKSIVIDAVDPMETLLLAHVVKASGKGSFEKMGWGKEDVVRDELRQMQLVLEHCRNRRGMHVVVVAHSDRRTVKDTMIGDYASYDIKAKVIGETLFNWADVVGFAHEDVAIVEGTKRAKLIGNGAVILHWKSGSGYKAKQRAGFRLPATMPLGWDAFEAELAKGPETAAELQVRIAELLKEIGDATVEARAQAHLASAKDDCGKLKAIANGLTKKLQEKTS